MKSVTRKKLRELLSKIQHPTFLGITALTLVRTPVGAPTIRKLSRVNLCVGEYGKAVERQRAREGVEEPEPFAPKPRKWGVHTSLAVVQHQKTDGVYYYLSAQVMKARKPIYLVESPPIKRGGKTRLIGASKESLSEFLPVERSSADAQGVAREIVHRDYSLESISAISMNGEVYKIIG